MKANSFLCNFSDAERRAENLRQQQLLEEQARQIERTNDLLVNLQDLVVTQARDIQTQRNKIEELNQQIQKLSTCDTEYKNVVELITTGINDLKSGVKACTQVSGLAEIPQEGSSGTFLSNSNATQRQGRFVLNREGPFAFHAVSDRPEISHIGAGQSIIFEQVLLNIGGAFHTNHSLFIAEMPGVYLFSASILSFVNDHSEYSAALVKNGSNLALVYGHGDSGRHDQGSVTVVTQLKAGDEVWVKLLSPADTSIYGGRYTTFSGVFLYSL